MTFQQFCLNWKVHNNTEKVPPLSMLNRGHVLHLKNGVTKLRQMQSVMKLVEKIARSNGCWHGEQSWTVAQSERMYEGVKGNLSEYITGGNRTKDISWEGVYNKMSKANAFVVTGLGRGVGNGRKRRSRNL